MRAGVCLLGLGWGGCVSVAPPTETDTDVVAGPFTGCDYAPIEGSWRGEYVQDGVTRSDFTTTFEALAEVDAKIGSILQSELLLPPAYCVSDLMCTGRERLGWYTVVELVLEGPCVDAYAFFRLEPDGSLSYEASLAEFGTAVAFGTLRRVE